jgi:hypothetical protein
MVSCSAEHEHIISLFGSERAQQVIGITLERAAWVPSCIRRDRLCYAHGSPPRELRGKIALLNSFPVGSPILRASDHAGFRRAVHESMALGSGPPGTILYVRTSTWPTRRHVADEERVVQALAKWAAAEHPQLKFSADQMHELPFDEEVARFADARVMISLWGSSLHNCRYMRSGSLVVELLGALAGKYGDTALYTDVCSRSCQLQHAPFGIPGAFPHMRRIVRNGSRPIWTMLDSRDESNKYIARVDPDALVTFLRRVFPADPCQVPDWAGVFSEYNRFLAMQPIPGHDRNKPLNGVGQPHTDPQYGAPRAECRAVNHIGGGARGELIR